MFIFSLINILADHKKINKKNKQTNIIQVHTFPKDCTFISVISKNYNQQSRSLHLRKLQSTKSFSTSQKITIDQHPVKAKTIRKRKRKGRRRRKYGRKGIIEEEGLKNIPSERAAPFEYVPWSSSINGQD